MSNLSQTDAEIMLQKAINWAEESSEQILYDMLRAMDITSGQLDALGYNREMYPTMHNAVS